MPSGDPGRPGLPTGTLGDCFPAPGYAPGISRIPLALADRMRPWLPVPPGAARDAAAPHE